MDVSYADCTMHFNQIIVVGKILCSSKIRIHCIISVLPLLLQLTDLQPQCIGYLEHCSNRKAKAHNGSLISAALLYQVLALISIHTIS